MATESVKILIEAEDKASQALRQATTEAEKAAAKAEVARVKHSRAIAIETVELREGAEAAAAFKLELEGIDSATAAVLAREQQLIKQQKELNAEQEKIANTGAGKTTKTSTEFFGAVANLAGGGVISSTAGQIASLTEKTSQFSEIAKQGGAAAAVFKAGLVGAAAVIGFQIGSAIGNAVFQTEKWNAELEKANAKLAKLEQIRLGNLSSAFDDFKAGLEVSDDPAADINERIEAIKTEIKTLEERKKADERSLKGITDNALSSSDFVPGVGTINQLDTAGKLYSYITGETKDLIAQKQTEISQSESSLEILRQQTKELERQIGIEKEIAEKRESMARDKASTQFVESLKEQLIGLQNELAGTKNEFEAFKNTTKASEGTEALGLLKEIELTKEKIELKKKEEQEKERAAEKEKERLKTLDELRKSEAEKLKEQAILLEQGKEAAHANRLEQQGLTKDQAAAVAAAQAGLDKEMELSKLNAQGGKKSDLQAFESRLLTRGSDVDPSKSTAQNTETLVKLGEKQKEILDKALATLESINNKKPEEAKPNIPVVVKG